jgi:hypothetical protein
MMGRMIERSPEELFVGKAPDEIEYLDSTTVRIGSMLIEEMEVV